MKSCEAYSVLKAQWRECPNLPRRLHHIAIAADDTQIYAAGGYVSLGFKHDPTPKLWSLKPGAQSWSEISDLPTPIGQHVMVLASGQLFLIGGETPSGDTGAVWSYSLASQKWTQKTSMPTPRNSMVAVLAEGDLWVLGGRSQELGPHIARVDIYNLERDEWRRGPDMPAGRGGHAAAFLGGNIHVFGGETFVPLKILDRHDVLKIDTHTWREVEPPPKPRHGGAAVVYKNSIYHLGGGARPATHTIYSASPTVQIWKTPN